MDKITVNQWMKNSHICLLCGNAAEQAVPICPACTDELPWLLNPCRICALPLPHPNQTCAHCLQQPPPFRQIVAPWRFDFPLDTLIGRFKHQSQWQYGFLLSQLLSQHLEQAYLDGLQRPQCLIPTPVSARRLRHRGFNQSEMMAQWLRQALNIPLQTRILARIRDTAPQQQLSARQRQSSLKQAFQARPSPSQIFSHVAIIDDVVTTGATATAMAVALSEIGISRIDIYCLARTP